MIVFINTFHVEPAHQQKVLDLLAAVTKDIISKTEGFMSSTLLRSDDGRRVVMYARWRSIDDYLAMREQSNSVRTLSALQELARFETNAYEIVEEFLPPDESSQQN
ncbi:MULTISPECIES: antibiotic biosynthesis monooxygenase family protein [unclassified Bradyrhizobium]|uniref:antibiotic biosynthesis monooxygenase family protein n=1 Tax=unclassified Bradyrhizobium TaxID=2631580 RepID=UPI0028E7BF80|nr:MULTISPECIES: antibiotic biosynthesis monooxygenase family protein [unclassified Bradyrhizobium]